MANQSVMPTSIETICVMNRKTAFKVQVGPPQISIHQGQTILISELDGQINWPSDKGLFFRDTRVISNWSIYANGEPWTLLNGGAVRRGRIATEWSQLRQRLRTTYRNGDFRRAIALSTARSSAKAAYANGRLSFEVHLQPCGRWKTCVLYTLEDGACTL